MAAASAWLSQWPLELQNLWQSAACSASQGAFSSRLKGSKMKHGNLEWTDMTDGLQEVYKTVASGHSDDAIPS